MSVSTPDSPPAPERTPPDACASCGTAMREDQEWCLECGTARTVLRGTKSWGVPVAMLVGVIALALAGFAVALIALSGNANRLAAASIPSATETVTVRSRASTPARTAPAAAAPARTQITTTPAVPKPAGTTTSTTTTTATTAQTKPQPAPPAPRTTRIGSWPPGLGGWTVVLSVTKERAAALATAHQLAPTLANVGVIDTDDHPSMAPGYFVVYAGRYPTRAGATAAAARLKSQGHGAAHARMVEPPGGN